jgi:hypothetical protein
MAEPQTGLRGTKFAAGTETSLVRDVAARIALLQPEDAPLIAFINGLKKKKETTNPKFEWFEDQLAPNVLVASGAPGTGTTFTAVTGTGKRVRVDDLLVSKAGEILRVSVIATDTITVVRGVGTVSATSIADAEQVVIMGNALMEGATNPTFKFTQKAAVVNYIQIFRDPVYLTTTQNAAQSYGGDDRTHQRKLRGMEHKRSIEQAFLFGDKFEDTTGTQTRRGTGGLLNMITTNVTDAGGVLTEGTFEAFCRNLFRYQPTTAAATKLFLASPIIISALNFWNKTKLVVDQSEKTFGTRLATYRSGHGDLDITRHWLLQDFTEFQKYGFAVDPQNLMYRYMAGLDTKLHVDIGLKTDEVVLDEYRTHAGLQLQLEKTHAFIKNVTGYAA